MVVIGLLRYHFRDADSIQIDLRWFFITFSTYGRGRVAAFVVMLLLCLLNDQLLEIIATAFHHLLVLLLLLRRKAVALVSTIDLCIQLARVISAIFHFLYRHAKSLRETLFMLCH